MDGASSFDQYRMPDAMWNEMEALLPNYPKSPKGGRPRPNLRDVADAIFYRMRTGCQWKAIPPSLASGSTAHQYYQEWVRLGIFDALWQVALAVYDELVGLDWRWQCVDGAITKAPLGGENTGKNPTDRGKQGSKRSLMTETSGIPIGLAVDGANVHDIRLLQETIEDCFDRFTTPKQKMDEHLRASSAVDTDGDSGSRGFVEAV